MKNFDIFATFATNMRLLFLYMILLSTIATASAQLLYTDSIADDPDIFDYQFLPALTPEHLDSLMLIVDPTVLSTRRLTDDDYRSVAEELGIEVASMKAVVEIEAGASHKGFHSPGKPIVNFDLTIFRTFARRRGIALSSFAKSHAVVFASPNRRKYGSYQAAQQARLKSAMDIDSTTAIYGTFWGMFQIGGFNWKKCGASSPQDFVKRMSHSEHEQLKLFARFLISDGLVKYLRTHNWVEFARRYNGPGFARHSYHTRLARSYAKHKKQ